jgi:mono/diheme cytochrome c family protein
VKFVVLLMFAALPLAAATFGAEPANPQRVAAGRALFQHSCAPCHARGAGDDGRALLPAPAALTLKYPGAKSPYIEERPDLTYPVVRVFVRRGSWSMPAFRKTEISDQDIEAIAAYLQYASKAAARAAAAKH